MGCPWILGMNRCVFKMELRATKHITLFLAGDIKLPILSGGSNKKQMIANVYAIGMVVLRDLPQKIVHCLAW